jgi:hypothetical protein
LWLEGLELRSAPSGLESPLLDEPAPETSDAALINTGGQTPQDQEVAEEPSTAESITAVGGLPAGNPLVEFSPTSSAQGGAGQECCSNGDDAAEYEVPDVPPEPVITEFNCSEGAGYVFTFEGTVEGYLPGMMVTFGGDPQSLQGQTADVDEDGHFVLVIQLSGTLSDEGTATAVAMDTHGQYSGEACTSVHQTGVG